jgi:hypothetical protein
MGITINNKEVLLRSGFHRPLGDFEGSDVELIFIDEDFELHDLTEEVNCVGRFDKNGNVLPGDRRCVMCGWVPYPYSGPCLGQK